MCAVSDQSPTSLSDDPSDTEGSKHRGRGLLGNSSLGGTSLCQLFPAEVVWNLALGIVSLLAPGSQSASDIPQAGAIGHPETPTLWGPMLTLSNINSGWHSKKDRFCGQGQTKCDLTPALWQGGIRSVPLQPVNCFMFSQYHLGALLHMM